MSQGLPRIYQLHDVMRWLLAVVPLLVLIVFSFLTDQALFLNADFPWLFLFPMLSAWFLGLLPSLAATGLLAITLFMGWKLGAIDAELFPSEYLVATLFMVLLGGELYERIRKRFMLFIEQNQRQQERLVNLQRELHLLRFSHDALEKRLAVNTYSLRTSLSDLRKQVFAQRAGLKVLALTAKDIMNIYSRFTWLKEAALYEIVDGSLQSYPIGAIGNPPPIRNFRDEMIQSALQLGQTVSVKTHLQKNPFLNDHSSENELLAVTPIIDTQRRIHALLVIYDMPFLAFQEENLQLLSLLAGHIGDLLSVAQTHSGYIDEEGEIFVRDLERAVIDRRSYRLPTVIAVILMPADRLKASDISDLILGQARGLDTIWLHENIDGKTVVLNLMPLSDLSAFLGYRARLESDIQARLGEGFGQAGAWIQAREIEHDDDVSSLLRYLCEIASLDCEQITYYQRSTG